MRFPRNEFSQFCEGTFSARFLWYNVSRNSGQKEYHENNKQLATCAQTPDICHFRKKGSPFVRIVPLALEGPDSVAWRTELVCVLRMRSRELRGSVWV